MSKDDETVTMMSGFIHLVCVSTTKTRRGIIIVDGKHTEETTTDQTPSGTADAKFGERLIFCLTEKRKDD